MALASHIIYEYSIPITLLKKYDNYKEVNKGEKTMFDDLFSAFSLLHNKDRYFKNIKESTFKLTSKMVRSPLGKEIVETIRNSYNSESSLKHSNIELFIIIYFIKYESKKKITWNDAINYNDKGEIIFDKSYIEYTKELLSLFMDIDNNKSKEEKGYRIFNSFTNISKRLRYTVPFKMTEIDFSELNPRIAGYFLKKNGFSGFFNKIDKGNIYSIPGKTRDEVKKKVNTVFNLHKDVSSETYMMKELIDIGIEKKGAELFIKKFSNKGDFYRYATKIEHGLILKLELKLKLKLMSLTGGIYDTTRLHDALFVYGDVHSELSSIKGFNSISLNQDTYPFKITLHD